MFNKVRSSQRLTITKTTENRQQSGMDVNGSIEKQKLSLWMNCAAFGPTVCPKGNNRIQVLCVMMDVYTTQTKAEECPFKLEKATVHHSGITVKYMKGSYKMFIAG